MNTIKYIFVSILSIALITFSSCNNDPDPLPDPKENPFEQLVYVGETEITGSGTYVKVYADEELFPGYNNLYIAVYDSVNRDEQITDAHVGFMPMMHMPSGMMHSCPFEAPDHAMTSGTKSFMAMAVFVMPGMWNLEIDVHNHATNQHGSGTLHSEVVEKDEPMLISFLSEIDSMPYFVTRIEPKNPAVGSNVASFGVYTRTSMMDFPAMETVTIKMEPSMPSMGHGSSNNVDPVHMEHGVYEGSLNFTMTGYWRVDLDFLTAAGDTIATDKSFDVTF